MSTSGGLGPTLRQVIVATGLAGPPGGSAACPTRRACFNHVRLLDFPGHSCSPPQVISPFTGIVGHHPCPGLRLFRGWRFHKPFEPLRYLPDSLHRNQFPFCQALSFLSQPYTEADDFVLAEWALESITTLM